MTRQVSALSGEVIKASAHEKAKAAPLRPYGRLEWIAVSLFAVAGIVLIGFALYDFQRALTKGSFVAKTTTTLASKTVEEKTYSDSFLIFTLTAGVMFLLLTGLYGRIRDVTLGLLKVDLADDPSPQPAETPVTPKVAAQTI